MTIIDKIIRSEYAPENTNVLWLNTLENIIYVFDFDKGWVRTSTGDTTSVYIGTQEERLAIENPINGLEFHEVAANGKVTTYLYDLNTWTIVINPTDYIVRADEDHARAVEDHRVAGLDHTASQSATGAANDAAALANQKAALAQGWASEAQIAATSANAAATGASRVNARLVDYELQVTNRNGVTTSKNVKGEKGEGINYSTLTPAEKDELAGYVVRQVTSANILGPTYDSTNRTIVYPTTSGVSYDEANRTIKIL